MVLLKLVSLSAQGMLWNPRHMVCWWTLLLVEWLLNIWRRLHMLHDTRAWGCGTLRGVSCALSTGQIPQQHLQTSPWHFRNNATVHVHASFLARVYCILRVHRCATGESLVAYRVLRDVSQFGTAPAPNTWSRTSQKVHYDRYKLSVANSTDRSTKKLKRARNGRNIWWLVLQRMRSAVHGEKKKKTEWNKEKKTLFLLKLGLHLSTNIYIFC